MENHENIVPKGKAAGGYARAKALSHARRTEIAKAGAAARYNRHATHEAPLPISNATLSAAVLDDGTRVLLSSTFMTALGRPWKGTYKRTNLPNFLDANNLIPFINKDITDVLQPIEYRDKRGIKVSGYKAELLPLVCDVWLKAREAGALKGKQSHIAKQAEMLVRSLSKVGIVALIDEVTGYQSVRPQDALRAYLDKLIRSELAAWVKKFPDEFYENIYKIKGWPWPGMSKNRFSVVAHYTRDLVYERLAKGVLDELERKTPKDEKGNRPNKFHQWLTEDVGNPMLAQHMHSLVMFQRLAIANGYGWNRFVKMVDQVLPRKGSTLELPLSEENDS